MSLPSNELEPRPDGANAGEPYWLVVLALGTWAALIGGIVIGLGGFTDPRPWHNGCVRLTTLFATFVVLIWAVRTVQPERSRGLKLAVVVSLIAHTLLAVMLSRQRLEIRALANETATQPMEQDAPVARLHPLNTAEAPRRNQSVPSLGSFMRPAAPVLELKRQAGSDFVNAVVDFPTDVALEIQSSGPKQLLKRGPLGLSSPELLPPAASLVVGAIELPTADIQQEQTDARKNDPTRPRPASEASELARSSTAIVPRAPVRFTLETFSADALDGPRVRDRRRRDAVPVVKLPAETERLAMRSTRRPGVADSRRPSPAFEHRVNRDAAQRNAQIVSSDDGQLQRDVNTAVERGLEFLARVQLDDGRWQFEYIGPTHAGSYGAEQVSVRADAAATGLALLALLGAGYDHFDGRYQVSVQHGLDYLCRIQAPSGELFPESNKAAGQVTRFYSHGIATLALCEAYGMTGDTQLRHPAQAAVDYLVATQHNDLGGWRYEAGVNADLSVTGWQLLALRTGELAGLELPPQTYERVREFLEACRQEDGTRALFRYNPWASSTDSRTRHGREPSTVMTSVGLLMQLHLDEGRRGPHVHAAADHLLANAPRSGEPMEPGVTGTLGDPGRDTYYWYYATQAMYLLGGQYWETWRDRLFPLLIDSQESSGPMKGSWDPRQPVADKWGSYGGRIYVTAMNLLSLEAANRFPQQEDATSARMAGGSADPRIER